ncbi:MAG: OmpA family protein [Chitinophagales bacterium]|nr:OmpA family protein [Chitinophagales bacterium]
MKKLFILILLIFGYKGYSQVHTLKESIYFGIGKTTLNQYHKKKLDSIVTLLKNSKSYLGEVKGHTCNIGSARINKVISNLRALNVLNYLVDKGLKRDKFTYSSFGYSQPIGDNSNKEGRALNRRTDVEVVLSLFDEVVDFKEVEENANSNVKGNTTVKNETIQPANIAPPIELGPDFSTGKIPKAGNKVVKMTNGITLEVDKNSLVTGSSEPIDLDFKDYTQNYDIIKKGFNTSSGECKNLSLIGAFSVNLTQEYQELTINSQKPLIVSIPGEYSPNAKLYTNPRRWTADTINKFNYNHEKKVYEVAIINNTSVLGIFDNVEDTVKFLKVKIKGLSPDLVKPYVVYDNCNISMCCRQKGKWFLVPVSTNSSTYRIRLSYVDYSSKQGDAYSINYDINNLDLSKLKLDLKEGNTVIYKFPEKIKINNQKLDKNSLCDSASAVGN